MFDCVYRPPFWYKHEPPIEHDNLLPALVVRQYVRVLQNTVFDRLAQVAEEPDDSG